MASRKFLLSLGTLLFLSANAVCSDPSAKQSGQSAADQNQPMSTPTRFDVIRGLNAELVFVRKPFPMGGKGWTFKNGAATPAHEQCHFLMAQPGPATQPCDRAKRACERGGDVDSRTAKRREGGKGHEGLVGMKKEMVIACKGRPEQKIRAHDDRGEYEEWIYGLPPQEMEFVRLYGDEVGRVEIMKVDGQKVVRTEKEVEVEHSGMAQPKTNEPEPALGEAGQPGAPSLRRPGEALPNDSDDQQQVIQERKIRLPHPKQGPVPRSHNP